MGGFAILKGLMNSYLGTDISVALLYQSELKAYCLDSVKICLILLLC